MNIVELFSQASFIVKIVMTVLLMFSLFSWTVIFQKNSELSQAKKQIMTFENKFWGSSDLSLLYTRLSESRAPRKGTAHIFFAGFKEFKKLYQINPKEPKIAMEGAERAMRLATNRELDNLDQNIPMLGTIASISPYIGLFGTVWGIMNAFFELSKKSAMQATLQMVAPHIGEALIATAIGLFAAIPAVMAYNRFALKVSKLEQSYYNFVDEFTTILQREAVNTRKS